MSALTSRAFDDAIRNPDNPGHLMVIKDIQRRIRVFGRGTLLAESMKAVRVMEIGRSLYHPVVYIPEEDLKTEFSFTGNSTHCPIKGDASYISFAGEEIGWVYQSPIAMAARLAAHYAFWPDRTRLVEGD